MTDTTPSAPGQYPPPGAPGSSPYPAPGQYPAGGFPPPAATPTPEAPPKKSGTARKIITIAVPVLLVIGFLGYRFVLPAIEDAKWKVGACIDDIATSEVVVTTTEEASVVDCNDAAAQARIIAVHEDTPIASMQSVCPAETYAGYERKGTLYCLVQA